MDDAPFDNLAPVLAPGSFVFDQVDSAGLGAVLADDGWVALVREAEGTTVLRPANPDDVGRRWARITLGIESGLDWVGVTAQVSTALARAGIACNVVAGAVHDHLFVPEERAREALGILAHR